MLFGTNLSAEWRIIRSWIDVLGDGFIKWGRRLLGFNCMANFLKGNNGLKPIVQHPPTEPTYIPGKYLPLDHSPTTVIIQLLNFRI